MRTQGVRRFGSGLNTWPLRVRVAVTVVPVVWVVLLVRAIVLLSHEPDPRPAALAWFVLAASLTLIVPFLRGVWRSSTEWTREQRRDELELRHQAELLRDPPVRAELAAYSGDAGDDDAVDDSTG